MYSLVIGLLVCLLATGISIKMIIRLQVEVFDKWNSGEETPVKGEVPVAYMIMIFLCALVCIFSYIIINTITTIFF